MAATEEQALKERIERLERENRHIKLVGILLVSSAIMALVLGAASRPRTIEAEKIVLVDNRGRARLTIGTPRFSGVAVDMNSDDPAIWLSDNKGTDRAILTLDGLFLASGRARPTVTLSSDPEGISRLKFYGADGKVSWSAP